MCEFDIVGLLAPESLMKPDRSQKPSCATKQQKDQEQNPNRNSSLCAGTCFDSLSHTIGPGDDCLISQNPITGDNCLGGATFLHIAAYSTTNGMLYLLVAAEAIVFIAIEANWIVAQAIIQTGLGPPYAHYINLRLRWR